MAGKTEAGSESHAIVGGPDFTATFAGLAGLELPSKDRELDYSPRPVRCESRAGPMSITRFRTVQEAQALMRQKQIELPQLIQAPCPCYHLATAVGGHRPYNVLPGNPPHNLHANG